MTRKTPDAPAPVTPPPLPRTGGAYVVVDGVLQRDPDDLPPPATPDLKEA
jgi:hypothetical protein